MSVPKKYRGLIVVVAVTLLLVLADKAFSYRLASFATTVVGDVIAEVAELAAPPPSRQTAIAPARPVWDASRFQFPSAAEFPAAFSALGYGDQPWISLGTPLVLDLASTGGPGRPGPRSTASFQNPSARQRSMARQSMPGSSGPGPGGTSSSGGTARLMSSAIAAIEGPQTEPAGAAASSADLAEAVDSLETSLVAELWPEPRSNGGSSGSGGGLSTNPNQTGADDVGAFGDTQYSSVSPSDLLATGSLSEALALDSATGEPGLDVQTVLGDSAVTDMPGSGPSDLDLEWLQLLNPEAGLELNFDSSSGAALRILESSSPDTEVLPEPALLAVFGIGLVALASRLRWKVRRARS